MIKFDEMTDEQRQPYLDHVANMTDGLLWCSRVWSAWHVGTMGPDDFMEMDEDWIYEKAKEMYEFFAGKPINPTRRVVTLTCSELLEALQFGAPDGESDEDQMATEMTIEWMEDGHSGKGYYAYYSELPEEGAIKLGTEINE